MLQIIYEWMKNIIVFMILTTVVLNLLGKGNYKKYVKLVTGLILVLLVIRPILTLTGNAEYMDFSLDSYDSLSQAKDLKYDIFAMEEAREIDIMKEYKQVILQQTKKLVADEGLEVVDMKLTVEENRASINFGKIHSMSLTARYQGAEESDSNELPMEQIIPIKRVTIDPIRIEDKENEVENNQPLKLSPMEIHIKKILSDFYNINNSNINITIQEDHDGTR